MPQRRLHWLWLWLRLSFYVASSYTHIRTYTQVPPHTHATLPTNAHTPFAIALQSCNPIRFYVASAVAASALKLLPLHAAVVVVIVVAMTVTTDWALLSTRHAKILQQQQQRQLCQLCVATAQGATSDLFA